jgi:NADH-quinone oxidoreductase subunit C
MTNEEFKNRIDADFKESASSVALSPQGEVILTSRPEFYLFLAQSLKEKSEYAFDHLSCLTAVDYPKENKFTLVSHLWSYRHKNQLTLKLDVPRSDPRAPTLENIWKSANWLEREVFDLYGVVFDGHSDLRRIMMPDDYAKHPLRKEFSDDGFIVKPN